MHRHAQACADWPARAEPMFTGARGTPPAGNSRWAAAARESELAWWAARNTPTQSR